MNITKLILGSIASIAIVACGNSGNQSTEQNDSAIDNSNADSSESVNDVQEPYSACDETSSAQDNPEVEVMLNNLDEQLAELNSDINNGTGIIILEQKALAVTEALNELTEHKSVMSTGQKARLSQLEIKALEATTKIAEKTLGTAGDALEAVGSMLF